MAIQRPERQIMTVVKAPLEISVVHMGMRRLLVLSVRVATVANHVTNELRMRTRVRMSAVGDNNESRNDSFVHRSKATMPTRIIITTTLMLIYVDMHDLMSLPPMERRTRLFYELTQCTISILQRNN